MFDTLKMVHACGSKICLHFSDIPSKTSITKHMHFFLFALCICSFRAHSCLKYVLRPIISQMSTFNF